MSANIIIVMFEVNIKNNGTINKIVPFAFSHDNGCNTSKGKT